MKINRGKTACYRRRRVAYRRLQYWLKHWQHVRECEPMQFDKRYNGSSRISRIEREMKILEQRLAI